MKRNIIEKTNKNLCLIFSESEEVYYVCSNDERKDIRFYSKDRVESERFLQQWGHK